jgi:hypothetical protein
MNRSIERAESMNSELGLTRELGKSGIAGDRRPGGGLAGGGVPASDLPASDLPVGGVPARGFADRGLANPDTTMTR